MNEPGPSFGRRQVAGEPTGPQVVFDVLFGILLPIACLAMDPIVFRGDGVGGPVLGAYKVQAYVFIGLQVVALALWLLVGPRMAKGAAWFAGPLAAGAVGAALVGVAILPFTLIGLLMIVGALGFSPFLTAFVFLRNALRARARGKAYAPSTSGALFLAGLLAAVLPAVAAAAWVERSFDALRRNPAGPPGLAERLGLLEPDRVVLEYQACPPGPRRAALARVYARLTHGGDIEQRLAILND